MGRGLHQDINVSQETRFGDDTTVLYGWPHSGAHKPHSCGLIQEQLETSQLFSARKSADPSKYARPAILSTVEGRARTEAASAAHPSVWRLLTLSPFRDSLVQTAFSAAHAHLSHVGPVGLLVTLSSGCRDPGLPSYAASFLCLELLVQGEGK